MQPKQKARENRLFRRDQWDGKKGKDVGKKIWGKRKMELIEELNSGSKMNRQ